MGLPIFEENAFATSKTLPSLKSAFGTEWAMWSTDLTMSFCTLCSSLLPSACRINPRTGARLMRPCINTFRLMLCRPSACCPRTPCACPHSWLTLLFCWASTCLFFKTYPGSISSRNFSLCSHRTCRYSQHHTTMIYFCVLEPEIPQEQWAHFTNCSILALSTVLVFQYYIQVIKILEQHSSQSPPCLGLPRM